MKDLYLELLRVLFWIVAAYGIALILASTVFAQEVQIVCVGPLGDYIVANGQCPIGYKFVEVVEELV
jgi:hypothetical protein